MRHRSRNTALVGALVALVTAVLPASTANADPSNPASPTPTEATGPSASSSTTSNPTSTKSGSASGTASSNTTKAPNLDEIEDVNTKIEVLVAQMLAAADAHVQTQGQLANAKAAVAAAEAAYNDSVAALKKAMLDAQNMAHDLYVQGPLSMSKFALLNASGPQDLIDQLVTLDHLSAHQAATLTTLTAAQNATNSAKQAADDAEQQTASAESAAAAAEQETQTQLAAQQTKLAQLQAEAGIIPTDPGVVGAAGAPGAVTGTWALPTNGKLTSLFEARWGTFHYGIDLAAPIGTPIYAAGNGTVMRAGEASGFGLAVYIRHDNGDVTVYGHVNQIFVSQGQRVTAGQNIASVGNRGYSTGPHLHFEVQKGMYGTRIDPIPWLAARGISV